MSAVTLIALQDASIAAMSEPRSSELRAQKMRGAVLRKYRKQAARIGFTTEQIEMQVQDIRDHWSLLVNSQEET